MIYKVHSSLFADILNFITPIYTDKNIWRVLVRDPINQFMRNEKYKRTLVEKLTAGMDEPNHDRTPTPSPTRSEYSCMKSRYHSSQRNRADSHERNLVERNDRNMHDSFNPWSDKKRTRYNDSRTTQRRPN